MEKFIITGASQSIRKSENELKALYSSMDVSEVYDAAVLMEINFSKKTIIREKILKRDDLDYQIQGYATNFTTSIKDADKLYIPTHASILVAKIEDFQIEQEISLKCFNDLHHVQKLGNKIWAASTGIDSIVCLDLIDKKYDVFPISYNDIVRNIDKNIDYRMLNTKPHTSHPNYINLIDGQKWVTRANQRDLFCIDTGDSILISDAMIHDGLYKDGYLYFTAVKGQIIIVNFDKKEIVEKIDLKIDGKTIAAWCRGLYINEEFYYVGFSLIRTTKLSENIKWLKSKLKNVYPVIKTMILKISRKNNEIVDRFEFDPSELTAIFSIIPI